MLAMKVLSTDHVVREGQQEPFDPISSLRDARCGVPWLLRHIALGVVCTLISCSDPLVGDKNCGDPVALRMMSYNVAQQVGEPLAAQITDTEPDFVAVQECADCDELLERLPSHYAMSAPPRSGVTMLYDSSSWEPTHTSFVTLGINDDGWGERVLHWARFQHRDSDHCVNTFSTHWCVTIRNSDDQCTVDQQLAYVDETLNYAFEREAPLAPVLLAGDFNVFDGFEDGTVIETLTGAGLIDVFRSHRPTEDATTFQGNSWAPPGRLDYIFASSPVEVLDAYIDRSLPSDEGIDHFPVVTTLRFGTP
ncbi:MAG: hypothetical protein GY811_25930 [Myxococcales bacterium]|nr:hypothetical protein [Myxococcales bacterium]